MATTELKPAKISQPLINSIPPNLLPKFDPIFAKYYEHYQAGRLATHQVPIEEFRANPLKYIVAFGHADAPENAVGNITEQECPVEGGKIKIKIYEPKSPSKEPRPVYINFHGGGWVFGDLKADFEFCQRVVLATGAVAFDVDYRLAPENPFPIPVEDCWTAFNWVRDQKKDEFNLDLSRVAVGGPSAGGHLSAVVALRARDAGIPLVLQILDVPVVDMDSFDKNGKLKADCPYPSYHELYHTVPLSGERMEYFARHFLGVPRPDSTYNNPTVSPIRATNFKGLAPALIVTGEMDLLRDEGEAYAKKLREAGVEVEYIMLPGMPHTLALLDDICEGGRQYNEITTKALRKAYGVSEKA